MTSIEMQSGQEHSPLFAGKPPTGEFSTLYDYVMVFRLGGSGHTEQTPYAKECCYAMLNAGLEIYPYLSVQRDELIVLIRAPVEKLAEFADKIDFRVLMDSHKIQEKIEAGSPEHKIRPRIINADPIFGAFLRPFEYIYGKYNRESDELYAKEPGMTNPFTKVIRLKLIFYLLESAKRLGGCGLPISKYLAKDYITAMFPTKDERDANQLLDECTSWRTLPWTFPFNKMKSYFGEKFTLFYQFVGHYCHWLFIPALVGLTFQLVVWGTENYSHPVLPFFGLLISIWSIVMLEYWKRKETEIALHWGMTEFEKEEPDRAEFWGEEVDSFINGDVMTYFPEKKRNNRISLSVLVVSSMIMLIIGVVAAIYVLRFSLQPDIGPYASTVASVLNAVQITIFNMIYQMIAVKMTSYENHRTDTQYEDSMISKLFWFQFVNSYSSFFFLAFIAQNLPRPDGLSTTGAEGGYKGQCGYTNCMQPLSVNLAIIFGSRLIVTNALDMLIPYVMYKRKLKSETSGEGLEELTPPEKDYVLQEYNMMLDALSRYSNVVIEYGFMVLFIVALPIACFLSMVNCYVTMKFSSWRQLTLFQRPVPKGAQDIGTWQVIFTIMSVIAVVTNAGLICFTMDVLNMFTNHGRLWIFIGFQWVLIFLQGAFSILIPDEPEHVSVQKDRMDFITSKLIDHAEDDDFDDVGEEGPDETRTEDVSALHKKKSFKKKKDRLRYSNESDLPVLNYPRPDATGKQAQVTQVVTKGNLSSFGGPKITSSDEVAERYKAMSAATTAAHHDVISPVSAVPAAAEDVHVKIDDAPHLPSRARADSDDDEKFPTGAAVTK